ncbi:MAG: hypothetical protein JSS09_05570 [Verrucomicrobia bacterium]|nr:hypothetical protein [Verrucomicrobiota bacterium]
MSTVTFNQQPSTTAPPKYNRFVPGIQRHFSDTKLSDFSRKDTEQKIQENERILAQAKSISNPNRQSGLHHRPSTPRDHRPSTPRDHRPSTPRDHHPSTLRVQDEETGEATQELLGRTSPVRFSSPPRTAKKEENDCCERVWSCFKSCFYSRNERTPTPKVVILSDHLGRPLYHF